MGSVLYIFWEGLSSEPERSGEWCVCATDSFIPGADALDSFAAGAVECCFFAAGATAIGSFAAGAVECGYFIPGAVAGQGGCGC